MLCITIFCKGQIRSISFENLTTDHGLSSSSVTAVIQDFENFIWIGTSNGLNRYDGYQFKVFDHIPGDTSSLANGSIHALLEDRNNDLWVGTDGTGIMLYDRISELFQTFQLKDNKGIPSGPTFIITLFEDHQGFIWIGSRTGLYRFDPNSRHFLSFTHDPNNESSIPHNTVISIATDADSTLWVGTKDGLCKMNPDSSSFTRFETQEGVKGKLQNGLIQCLKLDSKGNFWIGTHNGLHSLKKVNKQKYSFKVHGSTDDPFHFSGNAIFSILESEGGLWIGTQNGGLDFWETENQMVSSFQHINQDPNSILSNTVWSLYLDKSNVLWAGTDDGGISKVDLGNLSFFSIILNNLGLRKLQSTSIRAIWEDKWGEIWIGTQNSGLIRLDPLNHLVTHYLKDPDNPSGLPNDHIRGLAEDSYGNIWIGTPKGLIKFDRSTDKFQMFEPFPVISSNRPQYVRYLRGGKNGKIYATNRHNCVVVYDPETDSFSSELCDQIRNDQSIQQGLKDKSLLVLGDDEKSMIFLSNESILLHDFETRTKSEYKLIEINGLKSNEWYEDLRNVYLTTYYRENDSTYWLGTKGNGLRKILLRSSSGKGENFAEIEAFWQEDGLANNYVYGILHDDTGCFWISTGFGLSRLCPEKNEFENFYHWDGLQSNEFNWDAFHKSINSGRFYFGGIKGVDSFYPQDLKSNTVKPQVAITGIKILNKLMELDPEGKKEAGKTRYIKKPFHQLKELEIAHADKIITFEFSAFHYSDESKNEYAYKLEGFNEDWQYIGNQRLATFTNLDPGYYTFKVKASNRDGLWSEKVASLRIHITPPWWQSKWAYFFYFLLFILISVLVLRLWTRQQRSALDNERKMNEHLRKVDQLKDQFLANTSHELRTPLNGIIGLSEHLLQETKEDDQKQNLSMIISSGKRLASLVNDILDFSRLKNHEISLRLNKLDLHSLVEVMLETFKPMLKGKQLPLINNIPEDLPKILADEDRLQQIFYNLIGNAIKFTEHGEISVNAGLEDSIKEKESENQHPMIWVSVKDSGIGIPENKREEIFKAFEQADGSINREFAGTGLGLSISKKLTELHGGKMWVESETGEGSVFYFTLPVSPYLDEKQENNIPSSIEENNDYQPDGELASKKFNKLNAFSYEDPQRGIVKGIVGDMDDFVEILIVDDEAINHQVLRNYLKGERCLISSAMNGSEALGLIEGGQKFDLILLDVMMPKLSGYEVCRRIREKFTPTELPIIMITAKNQLKDLVQGLEIGANDYLQKPFFRDEFMARVKTHLNLRRINKATNKFVPHEFLQSLGKGGIVDVQLGDQVERRVTVLFADIRDYTTLSEAMSPQDNFEFLNEYLGLIGPCIRTHEGFVNQYFGDGIMAIFEEPVQAIKAAIEIHKALDQFNINRSEKDLVQIKTGIGIHTGQLLMGIIGDETRFDAGVVSDTVNTASRMEGLTKHYGSPIVISADTFKELGPSQKFNYRYLGLVQVKGKNEPIEIYDIFEGDALDVRKLKLTSLSDFKQGLKFYYRSEFETASEIFANILEGFPHDKAVQLYYHNCKKFLEEGVPENWSGVEMMMSK